MVGPVRVSPATGSSLRASHRAGVAGHGWTAMFGTDLVLVHAPSVYDFRTTTTLQGPIADVVPSTDQFEMYPIGLTSIAAYLERNNYNVRIVNLACRMLRSERFDAESHLRRLRAPVFGIDLHWLPHAHGALAVAELIKQLHPNSSVLMGGLSASYYHEELLSLPFVDFVLRGDSTEEPCRQLMAALRDGTPLEAVENLTFRGAHGRVVANPLSFVPVDLDGIDVPGYDYMVRSVLKYRDLADVVPYLEWLHHPTTMVLNSRGCTYDCAVCGGSRSAYRVTCQRPRPAYRSPERLARDVETIAGFSRAPIFMVHDPRIGGVPRARRFFELVAAKRVANEMVFELFYPAGDDFFDVVTSSVAAWSMEITIESADEALRKVNGKFNCSNAAVEATIASALDHGCRKLDLFFMVGIPHQTPGNALGTVDYCAQLADRFDSDPRLQFYVAPLGPFLDPGSRAFEDPALGYRRRFTTLDEHRKALLEPTWGDALSYETDGMTRQQIVETSYEVARRLNELKHDRGLIDDKTHAAVAAHLQDANEALVAISAVAEHPAPERRALLERLHDQIAAANTASLCGTNELRWSGADGLRISRTLAAHLAWAFFTETGRGLARFVGRFDTDVWRVESYASPSSPTASVSLIAKPVGSSGTEHEQHTARKAG